MAKKQKAPPPPNYAPIANASLQAQQMASETAAAQLAWAREQEARDRAMLDPVLRAQAEAQQFQLESARRDRERYEGVYQPLEDRLVADATSYASPERADFEAGRTMADVSQQMEQARRAASDQLESFGVDPSQTRHAALDLGTRVQEAALRAAAGTQSRINTEATGRALRQQAIDIGRGYPAQVAQSVAGGVGAGNAAVGGANAVTQTGASTMGTPTEWMGIGNKYLGTWGDITSNAYKNQLAAIKQNNERSSGWGQLAGTALGLGTMPLGGSFLGRAFGFQEGGEVPLHNGIPVDPRLSASNGAIPDDVPAKLTAGEFVIPADTVSWKGEEFFQKLIESSRQKKQEAGAKPQMQAIPA
jgi:hypothetical protein